jgi:PAS domain S-box-containing protein
MKSDLTLFEKQNLIKLISSLDLVGDSKLQSVSDIATHLFGTEFASISLMEEKEMIYLSTTGFSETRKNRENTFCNHTLNCPEDSFTIIDTAIDQQFAEIDWVKESGIRFYVGVPIEINGNRVGTLCVFDYSPRVPDEADKEMLIKLSKHISDIIELKKQNTQLDQLSLVAKYTENAVIITDNLGRIEYVNKAFEKLSHYEFNEVYGKKPGDLLQGPDTNPEDVKTISEALRNHESVDHEILNYTKEGEPYWLKCSISPVFDDNGLSKFISIEYDITEQKAREQELKESKEEAQASVKLKEQFLSNMSHEIRTPMNGVIGIANILLEDQTLTGKQKEYVNHIHYSAKNLLTVINDILDFSKINSEKLTFEAVNFDLPQVFKALHNTIGFRAKEKGVEFNLDIDSKMPRYVCGDPGRLNQILLNVVGNAIKFTEEGSVDMAAEINEYNEKGPQITVTVKDTGVGIAKEKVQSVFEEFQQENAYVSKKYGGSGLGLSISKQLVEMYGGTIQLDSVAGEGTEVTFTIQLANPIVELKEKQPKVLPNDEQLVQSSVAHGERILLVEDNLMNQIVAQDPLEKAGYQIELANNGLEAVEKIIDGDYDLILMDVQMPVMNGLEATKRIKEINPDIPIIAMTASVMQHDLDKCYHAGMVDSIGKPVNANELLTKVSEWMLANCTAGN